MLHRSLCSWRLSTSAVIAALVSTGTALAGPPTVVYSEDFAGCSDGGYALSGLWHDVLLSDCTPLQPGCGLYFGLDSPDCDFATGFSEAGNADSPVIDLSGYVAPITLTFAYRLGTEIFPCDYDIASVRVSDDGFGTSVLEAANAGCGAPTDLIDSAGWLTASVDLSAWAGSAVQLRFGFDSIDGSFNAFFGFAITAVEITAATATQSLSLEGVDCQDDVDPFEPGHQIAVELWMRGVTPPGATGFQAFVEFDETLLSYRDDLSSYTLAPFPAHILNFGAAPPFNVEWDPGRLRLDGSTDPFDPPAPGDAHLATLVFDVLDECATTMLDFGGFPDPPFFFSELSVFGTPLPTALVATGPLRLDDTDPMITCPADITVAAQVNVPICAFSDCCTSMVTPGCSDALCESIVCAADPFCCGTSWDGLCASAAGTLCGDDPCLGSIVTFVVNATDNCGPTTIVCTPPSGSIFPVGTTTVTCTATDECGNSDTCAFDVTVTATNEVLVDVNILVGSFTSPTATRCIHFQTESCGAVADVSLDFVDDGLGFQVTGPVVIEIPCGDWSTLCAKDEQHTKWDSVALVRSGTSWTTAAPIVLLPGDNDNDGDVDINDVTWLIFTFGSVAGANPCPFVFPGPGPRDADFSLNGVIAGEDYSLMSFEFLTFSSCLCTVPAMGREADRFDARRSIPIGDVDASIRDHVDLNRDGVFDAEDVAIFEKALELPDSLSKRLRNAS